MKQKQKNVPVRKNRKKTALRSQKKVVFIHAKRPGLRHFRLIGHKHTFKLIHHRHTSHLTLFIMLAILGFFIYASGSMAQAETSSGSVLVGVIVPGPPPTVGAVITNPANGYTLEEQYLLDISGTCYEDSFVVVKDNDVTVGSTACTGAGIFSLQIQLQFGKNILTALNYDNLNQAGPTTPSITVYVTQTANEDTPATIDAKTPTMVFTPIIPDNPSIIPGVTSDITSCEDYRPGKLPTGGEPHVAIVCVPRLFFPNMQQVMGVLVWGGTPPYALSIDFGDGSERENTLISVAEPSYHTIKFSYAMPNTYRIKFKLTDKTNETSVVQTSVQVNGEKESPIVTFANEIFGGKPWYESPVPFYLLAIAITLGFWAGDIFDRKYGAKKFQHRTSRAT